MAGLIVRTKKCLNKNKRKWFETMEENKVFIRKADFIYTHRVLSLPLDSILVQYVVVDYQTCYVECVLSLPAEG